MHLGQGRLGKGSMFTPKLSSSTPASGSPAESVRRGRTDSWTCISNDALNSHVPHLDLIHYGFGVGWETDASPAHNRTKQRQGCTCRCYTLDQVPMPG